MLAPHYQSKIIEAGLDEAGRGCLAGPVVAAAVILPENFTHPLLNDSKKLTEKQRDLLRPVVEKEAISWAVGIVDHKKIDEINILNASFYAMHLALDQLSIRPESLLIDGNRFHQYQDIPHHCMIKGDSRFLSIAAASILAKTYRDEIMLQYHNEFPVYQWHKNKGYPTKAHRQAIRENGSCILHRKTFRLLPEQMTLEL